MNNKPSRSDFIAAKSSLESIVLYYEEREKQVAGTNEILSRDCEQDPAPQYQEANEECCLGAYTDAPEGSLDDLFFGFDHPDMLDNERLSRAGLGHIRSRAEVLYKEGGIENVREYINTIIEENDPSRKASSPQSDSDEGGEL